MLAKDYYQLLKVERNATAYDIKKAYRKLAMEFHPDINTDTNSEEMFKAISEAYMVLGNNEKRRSYDLTGRTVFSESDNERPHPFHKNFREEACVGKCSGLGALFSRNAQYRKNKMSRQLKTKQSIGKRIK
ncbi:MAG: DnaJ domain-containing protein [Desulfobacula sp.]|jgi:molecular chaperone DnaJ|uniref:DnaJ domain-containing protein n=1 Tax=Desulfobacula sp. TaxID=2593537 RepID=UPI001D3985FC|nr:DnaJ domain-containing protein [Desulfobacula sp.]MBT4024283.1 DnaJ domain-containing protein [Desulfobacula sp.]MBT4874377.1 DnaJ domain-containing protein [Desulfobacula sp.]MBT5543428.1 DnaJ domain-containing protein [Desulfobacula sp.]MBT7710540.1 DnaJ domain-containing protein [Deltaproteobacteria bacterium]